MTNSEERDPATGQLAAMLAGVTGHFDFRAVFTAIATAGVSTELGDYGILDKADAMGNLELSSGALIRNAEQQLLLTATSSLISSGIQKPPPTPQQNHRQKGRSGR